MKMVCNISQSNPIKSNPIDPAIIRQQRQAGGEKDDVLRYCCGHRKNHTPLTIYLYTTTMNASFSETLLLFSCMTKQEENNSNRITPQQQQQEQS